MATTRPASDAIGPAAGKRALSGAPADNIRLDWIIAIFSCGNVFGLFIDGWAHNHGQVDNTFFTPWHALLYSAIGLGGLVLIITHLLNVNRGYRWTKALPRGYALSLIGFFAFAVGGLGDLFWHETFGFEESLEALLSPTHLYLALSGLLVITGPIRATWQRETDNSWRSLLPAIVSFVCIASIFTFFTTFAAVTSELDALTGPRPESRIMIDIYGILSFVVHANILLAVVLFMARRWQLPFGTITLLFTINALLMTWLHIRETGDFLFAVNAVAVGLLGDLLLARKGLERPASLRFFAFVMPFAFSLGALMVTSILGYHVWHVVGYGGKSICGWACRCWRGFLDMA